MTHDEKVKQLSDRDPASRRAAIEALTANDYEDAAVQAALLASLLEDGQSDALAFAVNAGWHVDPAARPELIAKLVDALEESERRGSAHGAHVATALHAIFENSNRVPDDALLERLGRIVTTPDDPAGYAGVTDIVALALHHGATSVVSQWLRGKSARLIVLATAALASMSEPPALADAARAALATLRADASGVPAQVATWAIAKLEALV